MTSARQDDIDLSDVLQDRRDLQSIRPLLKRRAESMRDAGADIAVEDLLALTRKNDTAYVSPSDVEKAEWFAELYDRVDEQHREHYYARHIAVLDRERGRSRIVDPDPNRDTPLGVYHQS